MLVSQSDSSYHLQSEQTAFNRQTGKHSLNSACICHLQILNNGVISEWKGNTEKNLSIEYGFPGGTRLMGILCIHLKIYLPECGTNYQPFCSVMNIWNTLNYLTHKNINNSLAQHVGLDAWEQDVVQQVAPKLGLLLPPVLAVEVIESEPCVIVYEHSHRQTIWPMTLIFSTGLDLDFS